MNLKSYNYVDKVSHSLRGKADETNIVFSPPLLTSEHCSQRHLYSGIGNSDTERGDREKKCMEKGGKMNYCFVLFPPFILYSFTHIHAIYLLLFFPPGKIYTVSLDMIREQLFIDNSTRSATTSLYKVHHEQKENLTHSSISP